MIVLINKIILYKHIHHYQINNKHNLNINKFNCKFIRKKYKNYKNRSKKNKIEINNMKNKLTN